MIPRYETVYLSIAHVTIICFIRSFIHLFTHSSLGRFSLARSFVKFTGTKLSHSQ